MLKNRRGLVYGRMPMDRIADAVEKLREEPEKPPATLAEEIDVAFASFSIPVTAQVRVWLVRMAYQRNTKGGDLRPLELLEIMLSAGRISQYPTDPSAMLWEAASRLGQPLGPGPLKPDPTDLLSVPADPDNPVRFSKELMQVLRNGYGKQREHFLNRALGAKGLVVGYLTFGMDERPPAIRAGGPLRDLVDRLEQLRTRFREVVRERVPETAQQWLEALELETASVPKLDNDQPWSGPPRDHLKITNDAIAIANVAAATATSLPLAFGIFGDLGAGKTFFMRLVHDQIARVFKAKAGNDGF